MVYNFRYARRYPIPDKPQPEPASPKAPPKKTTSPPPKYRFRHGAYVRRLGQTSKLLNPCDSKDKTPAKKPCHRREGPCVSGIEEISQLHNHYDHKPILPTTVNPQSLLLKASSNRSEKTPTALPFTKDERGILDDDPTERPQATLLTEGHLDRLALEQKHIRKAKAVKRIRSTLDPNPFSGHEAFGPGYEADHAEQERLQKQFGAETLADQRPRPAIYGLSPVVLGPLLDISPSPPPPSPPPPSPPSESGAQVKNNPPAAGGAASDAADASKANMAYYEKLRSDIRETIQRQRIIAKKLVALPYFPFLPPSLPNGPQSLSRAVSNQAFSHILI
ncbi:MAG: hypothetical protein M1835_003447 [Candelina submexicana]|nr:MAG: hypothetical protein M1835_003447 [Candelina submexicana]